MMVETTILDTSPSPPKFKVARDTDRYAAVGRAAALLMNYDSFGTLPFRQVTSLIVGQINRDHYYFILRDGQPTGFLGWALCSEDAGEAWLRDSDVSGIGDGADGPCVVFNTWVTDGSDMITYVVSQMRDVFHDKSKLVARRRYKDGRIRPMRIRNSRLP